MQDRPYQAIIVAVDGGVAKVTLNNPDRRNAIGPPMINELLHALDDAHEDDAVRSVVLTGAGKAFCAGADFSQMTGGAKEQALPHKGDYKDLLLALWRTKKPVIARVNGHAMGGGLGMVAASTFAVASTDAKLGTPEINVGLFPFMIMAVLDRVMPRRRLVEMMIGGQRISAEEAAACGLVNRAVAPDALDASVAELTDMIASKSPMTVRIGLETICEVEEMGLDEKLPILNDKLGQCLGTEDAREGLMAFLQKRKPVWKGR